MTKDEAKAFSSKLREIERVNKSIFKLNYIGFNWSISMNS